MKKAGVFILLVSLLAVLFESRGSSHEVFIDCGRNIEK